MGKMKIGSAGNSDVIEETVIEQSISKVIETPKIIEVEIPKPVTKEIVVEIPKPVYKIVEVEEVVQKPKIRIEEVQQSVIKPIFSIKTETIVLDQLQKKLDESVAIASNKLAALNTIVVAESLTNENLEKDMQKLKLELKLIKTCMVISAVAGVVIAIVALVG